MHLKTKKCSFLLPSVEYLGHRISAEGHKLLKNKAHWTWGKEQQLAFDKAKAQLTSSCLLMHFDPEKEVILPCDASPYGVGAVLSHQTEDGGICIKTPLGEKKYAHLSIIFGVKKVHGYLLGRKFKIHSDQKPLQHLLDSSRAVPQLASTRLQRWALTLSAYDHEISYKPGDKHANADSLSRLPLPAFPAKTPQPADIVLLMETLQASPTTARHICQWTDKYPLLSRVRTLVLEGWWRG